MQIAPNHKYACWYFSRTPVATDLPGDALFENDVYVARDLQIKVDAHWKEWLGSLLTQEIKAGGFALYVTAPSAHPKVLDAENEALRQRCDDVLNGLLLQGVPPFQEGMLLVGANLEGEIEIRQFSPADPDLEPTYGSQEFRPGLETVRRAIRLAGRLRAMQDAEDGKWGRLLRAVRVLLTANRTSNAHGERFHQFVRSLDGIVKTRPGRGAKDFARRAQTFAVASAEVRATLTEMYNLRGTVEHLNSLIEAIQDESPSRSERDRSPAESFPRRVERANRLTRQIDALARFAFCHILETDKLFFEVFATEDGIDRFWSLQNHERTALSGKQRLDICAIR